MMSREPEKDHLTPKDVEDGASLSHSRFSPRRKPAGDRPAESMTSFTRRFEDNLPSRYHTEGELAPGISFANENYSREISAGVYPSSGELRIPTPELSVSEQVEVLTKIRAGRLRKNGIDICYIEGSYLEGIGRVPPHWLITVSYEPFPSSSEASSLQAKDLDMAQRVELRNIRIRSLRKTLESHADLLLNNAS